MNVNDQFQNIVSDLEADIARAEETGTEEELRQLQAEMADFIHEATAQMGS